VFSVQGVLDDVPYTVVVDPADLASSDTDPSSVGAVYGSVPVVTLLRAHDGSRVAATPTGPFYDLDCSDGESVLAALHGLTTVTAVDGDAPEVVPPSIVGAEY
jgi:hypothetical protein